jgi:hypothetical protein
VLQPSERSPALRSEVLDKLGSASPREHLLADVVDQHPVDDHHCAGCRERLHIIRSSAGLLG